MDSVAETSGEGMASPACPPSVPEHLWRAVPESMRQEFLEAAARGLRRGVHPEETFSSMLKDKGLDAPARAAPPARRLRTPVPALSVSPVPAVGAQPVDGHGKALSASAAKPAASVPPRPSVRPPVPPRPRAPGAPKPPSPALSAAPLPGHDRETEKASPALSRPLVPWGTKSPSPGASPRGVIGVAIHKAMNASGAPGREAARIEATVLDAIAADPALAFWDPVSVRSNGARISMAVAEAIAGLVAQEAERVIEDTRTRADAGDPAALRWVDPDRWSQQHDEEPSAPGP